MRRMNIVQAEENLKKINKKFSKESFIFDLLGAYDFPKSTISKLKIKLKKNPEDDAIVPGKLHFVGVSKKELDAKFDELLKDYATVKKQPRFIIVTDYQTIKAYDTKMGEKLDTDIKILSKHPDFFLPWAGIEKKVFQGENPADVKAAEKLAKFFDLILQDNLKLVEKNRHALNVFLTRILFCFFAEDTDIFEKGLFTKSINDHTNKDGNDLADYLQRLFEVLNKKSRAGLPEYLSDFPYVNGGLFADDFPIPKFSKRSRESLIDLGSDLNWAEINPDIFGSMIQAVVHPDQRAGLGMHYTSVTNIMKVIEPLFLSDLKEEFVNAKGNKPKLKKLLERISNIKIFDPACGSGNFLIIAYKELRLLEMEILKVLGEIPMSGIFLSHFYGIEIDDFAHEVAKLSLWLTEHQIDILFNKEFGQVKASLPLKESGRIICGNAIQVDWSSVCPREGEIYILGNPPYLGFKMQDSQNKKDIELTFKGIKAYKKFDYITCWVFKASKYIQGINSKFSFVSTNSLFQGEHVSLLWPNVVKLGLEIDFAYESFKWKNSAKGNAAVICNIFGIRNVSNEPKFIFTEHHRQAAKDINFYLSTKEELTVSKRSYPISDLPEMFLGNMPKDDGNLLLTEEEMRNIIDKYPESEKFFRKLVGAYEFIRGIYKWCIWITDKDIDDALEIPPIKERVNRVKKFRLDSTDESARKMGQTPYKFREQHVAKSSSIIIPTVTSEKRDYIPMGFLSKDVVVVAPNNAIYDPPIYVFGVLSSRMHMVWVRRVAGRLKTDYRYSSVLCYNTFPLPELTQDQKKHIEEKTLQILSVREKFSGTTLLELYNSIKMPALLKKAHQELDDVLESCYQNASFKSDDERLQTLFVIYKKKTEGTNE